MKIFSDSFRSVLRKLFAFLLGDKFKEHRIPFGPIAGYLIYMKPSISPRMYLGVDEGELTKTVLKLVRKNDCVYDVGAHIGYTSIQLAVLVGTSGSVHAFELMPSTAAILEKSLSLNNFMNYQIHKVGLGSQERTIYLKSGHTYMGSLSGAMVGKVDSDMEECMVVQLDEYRAENQLPLPMLIKMDIERAEVDALQGARQTIADAEPFLLIEFHSQDLLKKGLSMLNNLGYELQMLSGEALTQDSVSNIEYFHQTVLGFKRKCELHRERLGL